ncbi:putative transcriptional regulator [Klebsiella pneumoniae subsp. ozaenae]|uniref:Putative transcriptional regulator n=1 Tax=Klebsiella pneumoniae subsp. ozaenae TaxID=574 RepID=A0A377ZCQ9_KLEPO|nr:putative transcriptional regulator [Klebsiella pneumoniae subsp. ozaenae]
MMNEPWQRLPALSLKQLQYFVTLAQLRHFTDTASRLAISQPALSSALRQIETVLGGKLVNRTAATVTLTELGGGDFYPTPSGSSAWRRRPFPICSRLSRRAATGRCGSVWRRRSVRCCFRCCRRPWLRPFRVCALNFTIRPTMRLSRRCSAARLISASGRSTAHCPQKLLVYPLREDPFVAVLHRDDPLAAQAHLPWKQLVGRDIAVFSKGNIQRLVAALVESHRLTLTTRYQVDYIETLYGLVRSRLAVAILPALYTTHLQDPALRVAQLQQPAARPHSGPDARPAGRCPRFIEDCFSLLQAALR